ncbi:hypothetical protein ONZ45_g3387 [Pleurotus djamor]|nr:hypothetical protein ONZ45_g3387 [Pleurotus djamor]
MSEPPTEPDREELEEHEEVVFTRNFKVEALTHVTFHQHVPTGKNGKTQDKKIIKKKKLEHLFNGTLASYVAFLNAIVQTHGEDKYTFTAARRYGFKVLVPPDKAQNKATDVENHPEWIRFVKNLHQNRPNGIQVYADMDDIQAGFHSADTSSAAGSANGEGAALGTTSGGLDSSETERSIARFRGLLEREYGNSNDSSYTYNDNGISFPLTPFMMTTWARYMHDGKATIKAYPNLPLFDIANRQIALTPGRPPTLSTPAKPSASAPPPTSDIGHLATILTTLLPSIQHPSTPSRTSISHSPAPETQESDPDHPPDLSPLQNTPSKLRRFLKHAETKLGVPKALEYEFALDRDKYGPDILDTVPDNDLVSIGIPRGDVIRLKRGSTAWWKSGEARKRPNDDLEGSDQVQPPPKRILFEERFHAGGGSTFSGTGMEPSESLDEDESQSTFWYMCKSIDDWLPVPRGYVPIRDDGSDFDGFN